MSYACRPLLLSVGMDMGYGYGYGYGWAVDYDNVRNLLHAEAVIRFYFSVRLTSTLLS